MRYSLKFNLAIISVLLLLFSCGGNIKTHSNGHENDSKKSTWKLGVSLYSFRQFSFAESLDMAKKAGVKDVEGFSFQKLGDDFNNQSLLDLSDSQLEKMKKMIRNEGLTMISLYAAANTQSEWAKYFEIGDKLGLKFLVGEPKRVLLDFVDSLAGAHHIQFAIHEHGKGESAYWHPDSVLTALQGRQNMGACVDLGHWARSGLDPVKGLKELAGHIISLHAKNVVEAGNLKADWTGLDQGVIDYQAVIDELQQQGFSGSVNIEDERKDSNLEDVQASVVYLKGLKANYRKEK